MTSIDGRKGHQSPRPKGRENARNILCRNMTLYGSCRTQNTGNLSCPLLADRVLTWTGCPYSHEVTRFEPQQDNARRFLNVESPSFTPLSPVNNNNQVTKPGISPKAAAAAIFTPRASGMSGCRP